ncbi:MAG: flavodoxin-dependent (E)-4-hydroxy-3-methylbut-2-enyl-diphosphate synthase [bacterium]
MRRRSRAVKIGDVRIGGDNPVVVQSMTNTDTRDVSATVEQIEALEGAGCEIVRVAVPDERAARRLHEIKERIRIPLVADIQFDYRLALIAIEEGVDKLRLNPGNIGGEERVKRVVEAAGKRGIPIRIGVNTGSLDKDIARRYGVTPEGLAASAMREAKLLESLGFRDIVLSLKASDVPTMIRAYQLVAELCDYPLHLGVTEAGTVRSGTIKSAIGIGTLLSQGIGDTIRVSLTANPAEEVRVGWEILKALGLRKRGIEIISCPTCGRTQVDIIGIAEEVERRTANVRTPLKVAIMGCAVNGPGEAKMADVGIAGGKGMGLLFRRGEAIRSVEGSKLVDSLLEEIGSLVGNSEGG